MIESDLLATYIGSHADGRKSARLFEVVRPEQ
jgi:hypothetical protein